MQSGLRIKTPLSTGMLSTIGGGVAGLFSDKLNPGLMQKAI
jgi:hypothetical protein